MTEKIYARTPHVYLCPARIKILNALRQGEESDQEVIYRLIDEKYENAFPQGSDHIHVEED